MIRRWLRERRDPARKCARVGHRSVTFQQRGYRNANGFPGLVAYRVVRKVTRCRRCKAERAFDVSKLGLSGLTLPTHWMETLKHKGEVWTA